MKLSPFAFIQASMQRFESQSLYDPLICAANVPWMNEGALMLAALATAQAKEIRELTGASESDKSKAA